MHELYVTGNVNPTVWNIYRADNDAFVRAISTSQLNSTYLAGVNRKYFYHDGRVQTTPLPVGAYYCVISFPGSQTRFSEVFQVCDFSILQTDIPYLKLQWYNDSDLNPIFYNDKVSGVPRFTNVLYVDSFIHEYEPEIVVEPETDGLGKPYGGFKLANLRYRISIIVPAYLKKALVLTQMHDHVILTTAGPEHRTGELENLNTSTDPVLNGAFTNLEITFEDNFIQKTSCNQNMV